MIRAPGLRCACLPCSTYCSSTPARAKRLAPFSSARLLTTRRSKHTIRAPGLRCACLPCSTYCSSTPARAKRLAPFSSARLAPSPDGPLTHFASPRGEKCRLETKPSYQRLEAATDLLATASSGTQVTLTATHPSARWRPGTWFDNPKSVCEHKKTIVPPRYSSVAQLVEHPAVNRRVVGSSPT